MVVAGRRPDAEAGEGGGGDAPEPAHEDVGNAGGPPGAEAGGEGGDGAGARDQDRHHRGDREVGAHRGMSPLEPDTFILNCLRTASSRAHRSTQ